MLRFNRIASSPGVYLISLFLSYSLIISIFSPLAVRPVKAEQRIYGSNLSSNTARQINTSARREGELLVRFRGGVSEQEKNQVAGSHEALRTKRLRGESGIERLSVSSGQDLDTTAVQLRLNPSVEFAEPNFIITRNETVPNDARFSEQWALHNLGQSGGQVGSDIGATQAWDQTTGSASTIIAVIDSGIDFSHPDLRNNEWANNGERQNGRDDDRDGFIDDTNGWDWVTDSNVIRDEQGHGTAVAGIIASEGNNGVGTTGVMWRASLMSLRVLDNTGTGSVGDAVEAIDYAASHGAQVINLSWGTDGESAALRDAIDRAGRRGVVVVCSAGNGGRDIDSTPYYPASYGLSNLIAVASTDQFDNLAQWSNYGASHVQIAAPGTDILTTQIGDNYQVVTGTSASAPIVTGVAGLVKTLRPQLSANNTIAVLIQGVRRVSELANKLSSGGIISAWSALGILQGSNGFHPGNGGGGNGNSNQGDPRQTPQFHPDPNRGKGLSGTPAPVKKGAPAQNLPNLDEVRKLQPTAVQAPAPIHANTYGCPSYNPECDYTFNEGGTDPDHSTARILPVNETGPPVHGAGDGEVNAASQDFFWSLPLLGLKGRAGLDLSLTLSYNSLVWTKQGSYIQFNADNGFPAPGFKLGFPTIQQRYYNSNEGVWAYMLVTSSGGRVELRQIGTSNYYDAGDGSYTQLTDNGTTKFIRTSDGTLYTFTPSTNGEFHCSQIEDRNGNLITINYSTTNAACIASIVDTLGRVINFNYNSTDNSLQSISQTWNGTQHNWATFSFGDLYVLTNFSGLYLNGPNNQYIAELTQVGLDDGSYYQFSYNSWGQVYKVSYYGSNGVLRSYTSINLPLDNSAAQSDCPKFSEKREWAQNWNSDTDGAPAASEEALTSYSVTQNATWTMPDGSNHTGALAQVTMPDRTTVYKAYAHSSGWDSGLPILEETWSNNVKQRWVTNGLTQDNTALSYPANPRVIETNIYDSAGNRRRSTIGYYTFTLPDGASCSLPTDVTEYASDAVTQLRRAHTDYRFDSVYLNNRIIGLPAGKYIYDGNNVVQSKTTYDYDWSQGTGHLIATPATATQHDETNFSASSAAGRGNLVLEQRWDATDPNNYSKVQEFKKGYCTTGDVAFSADPYWHKTIIEYNDSFSDGNNSRNTFAYPTAIIDPDQRWAQNPQKTLIQYNFDFGAVTRTQGLTPAGNSQGAIQTITYDSAGRIDRATNVNNGAYTRYYYGPNYTQTYSTITDINSEAYTYQQFDGTGRVFAAAAYHPGSSGGYTAQNIIYDVMGRLSQQSNPTEITWNWIPTGDDAAGFVYTTQSYDWKSRPTLTINPDGTTSENIYGGCGCAGGEVVTTRDEAGRRRRMTMDVVGRLAKVEELNWDQSVYSTTNYAYNVLDQLTQTNQQGQVRSIDYDGFGRLWHRTTPEQGTTTYSYNLDNTINWVQDARGAKTIFGYNNSRQLVSDITRDLSGVLPGQSVAQTSAIHYDYDAVGNRTGMTDGLGSVSYQYDQLSRMIYETRTFSGLGSYTISYSYNLAGELTSITNPWSAQASYQYDITGRVSSVSGANYAGVSSYINGISYRAFNGVKQINYANGRALSVGYNNRLFMSSWNVGGVLGYTYDYNQYGENGTGKVTFAHSIYDSTLDRSYYYDQVGRLSVAYTGSEARATIGTDTWGHPDGPYAQGYNYDVWGNTTQRYGWGGSNPSYTATYTNNRRDGISYDYAGNHIADGGWSFGYDADERQSSSTTGWYSLYHYYDGDGQRVAKTENGTTTYYLRSSVLGGQVICEITSGGGWQRGYVYLGSQLLALQYSGVYWVHQDPVAKSQRITDSTGNVTSTVELDPWGGDTWRSSNQAFQPHMFTSYEREGNGSDYAMNREMNIWFTRFYQPDPNEGSYSLTDPQTFNRYSYVGNDPVNRVDPSGLVDKDNAVKLARDIAWFDSMGLSANASVPYGNYGLSGHFHGPNNGFINLSPEMQEAEGRYETNLQYTISLYWLLKQNPELAQALLEAKDSEQDPNELIHCDPTVQAQIQRMRQEARRTHVETGFSVDRDPTTGRLTVSNLMSGPLGTEVNQSIGPNTVATFHMHLEMSPNPSPHDRANARGQGNLARTSLAGHTYVSYVSQDTTLTLYNGAHPKTNHGRDRVINAPKCPPPS